MSENSLDHINEEYLQEVEHLLSLSLRGTHCLFDKNEIKEALGSPINGILEFELENRSRVQEIFLSFVNQRNLMEKREFLKKLTIADRELFIKTYFNILENTLKKCSQTFH